MVSRSRNSLVDRNLVPFFPLFDLENRTPISSQSMNVYCA
uniref:Uncharacterized protein n=1 Tax=Rhizophora mucronata TaxID=61149 RepID=A0A2P2NG77_RHIMU